MPQEWEYGNAARQPAYDESANPFAPIDYASRLQNSERRRRSVPGASYQPGQMYGAPTPSAPPMAAPEYEAPSYLQPPQQPWQASESYPVQGEAGAPYSAALFEHQPTAVMPSGWEEGPFAARPAQDMWQELPPIEMPVWPEEEEQQAFQPAYYAADDVPLRDPFTPAQPREDQKAAERKQPEPPKKQRPPIRLDRLLALIAAGVMLAICAVVGGGLVLDLARNEREVEAFRSEYLQENGVEVHHGAAKVDLLPEGQTYVPTATPSPTIFAPTPSPTPIIPINEASVLGLSGYAAQEVVQAESTPAPVLRTRLTAYPKNPMCNITESLRELVAENSDVIGRLVIDGVLDEMVMQRNNTYYLTRNAIGSTSEAGAVFADESCTLRLPPENLLLRGQSAVPGKTFAPLWQYVSGGSEFVGANMLAKLTTLYEEETYVLFAVIVADSDPSSAQYFNYASNPTFTTDEAMLQYVASARQRSLYQFNVDVTASDRLLTLATLGNGENSLVLIYRMVRDTENMGQ